MLHADCNRDFACQAARIPCLFWGISIGRMHWYLVYTKPRQESWALENLERQGFECYLPTIQAERLRQGALTVSAEPLFPRYLFIRPRGGEPARGWAPVRSTKGVSRLVTFAQEPARVDEGLVERLKAREARPQAPEPLFSQGERVQLTTGPFAGLDGIYQMADGERRVMVLIEMLSKPVAMRVAPASLRKIG